MLGFQGHTAYSTNHHDNSCLTFSLPLPFFFRIQLSQLIIFSTIDYNEAIYLGASAMCPGISDCKEVEARGLQDHSSGLNLARHAPLAQAICAVWFPRLSEG